MDEVAPTRQQGAAQREEGEGQGWCPKPRRRGREAGVAAARLCGDGENISRREVTGAGRAGESPVARPGMDGLMELQGSEDLPAEGDVGRDEDAKGVFTSGPMRERSVILGYGKRRPMPRSNQPSRPPQCSQEQPRDGKTPGPRQEERQPVTAQGGADHNTGDKHSGATGDQSPQAGDRQLASPDDGRGCREEVVQWGLHAHALKSGISAERVSVTVFSWIPCGAPRLKGLSLTSSQPAPCAP